jgi:ribose-phosphate pyrophosphokinase
MSMTIESHSGRIIHPSLMTFSGGERHIQLPVIEGSESKSFTLRARLKSSDDVFDLLLARNALVEAYRVPVHIELPYLPYARQDRVCAPGQAFSLKVFASLLAGEAHDRLAVWDCHSSVGLTLTGALNVKPSAIMASSPALSALVQHPETVLICPDKGATARCEDIAQHFGGVPLVYCNKVRDPMTGRISSMSVSVESLIGKTALITDDICDGGMTFIKIAEQLRARKAERIILYVTHGIFSKGLEVFDGLVDQIFTTDSFLQTKDPRLTCISYKHIF